MAMLAGTAFGEYGEGYMRVSYANSPENITTALGEDAAAARAGPRLMGRRIVVTRRIPDPALELLRGGRRRLGVAARPAADRRRSCTRPWPAPTRSLTLLHDRVDGAFLDAAGPQLQVVANVAVGYDNVDVAACTAARRARSRTRPAC